MQGMKTLQTTGFYGDTTRWFIGTVIRNTGDPLDLGRLKVRIVGIHDNPEIRDADLPWASLVIPTTEVGLMYGRGPRIGVGAQVVGIFLDGPQSQQPLVIGSIPYTLTPTETQVRQSAERGGSFEESYAQERERPRAVEAPSPSQGEAPAPASVPTETSTSSEPALQNAAVSAGSDKIEQAFNFFMSSVGGGYTAEQSAGIVGNLIVDSNSFEEGYIDGTKTGTQDGEPRYGIWQKGEFEWYGYLDACVDAEIHPYVLDSQLLWVKIGLENEDAGAAIENTSRADHAAIEYMRKYRRPAYGDGLSDYNDPPSDTSFFGNAVSPRVDEKIRVANALSVYNTYGLVG